MTISHEGRNPAVTRGQALRSRALGNDGLIAMHMTEDDLSERRSARAAEHILSSSVSVPLLPGAIRMWAWFDVPGKGSRPRRFGTSLAVSALTQSVTCGFSFRF